MKKLLGIVVLSLLFNGNVYPKDIKLICNDIKDESVSHILIINDKKKTIKVEDDTNLYISTDVELYNSDEVSGTIRTKNNGKLEHLMVYTIDRRVGILTLTSHFLSDNSVFRHKSKCELFKKNKF